MMEPQPPTGAELITAERQRQIAEEGWTPQPARVSDEDVAKAVQALADAFPLHGEVTGD